jgi:hypothetical protein
MMRPHAHRPDTHALLQAALEAPSIYDEALRLLARRGLAIPESVLQRDLTQPHESDPTVVEAWAGIYAGGEADFDLYELAEELVDLEDAFQTWRFRHARTVERIIGHAPAPAAPPASPTSRAPWSGASSPSSTRRARSSPALNPSFNRRLHPCPVRPDGCMRALNLFGSLPRLINENTAPWDWLGQLRLSIDPGLIRFVDLTGSGASIFDVALNRQWGRSW